MDTGDLRVFATLCEGMQKDKKRTQNPPVATNTYPASVFKHGQVRRGPFRPNRHHCCKRDGVKFKLASLSPSQGTTPRLHPSSVWNAHGQSYRLSPMIVVGNSVLCPAGLTGRRANALATRSKVDKKRTKRLARYIRIIKTKQLADRWEGLQNLYASVRSRPAPPSTSALE